ncbi:MAG: ferritin-like domain-containing protein [Alphaproteobacteria bacterium]
MPALRSAEDLLILELKQIHSAERQLSRALPRLARQADSDRLREMLERRREQGAGLIDRIEDALEEMQATKARQKNVIAEALIEDINEHLDTIEDDALIDAFVLAAVQKTEHYCIAAWGTAAALARLVEEDEIVQTMEQALDEGKRFDEEMTKLAEEEVNPRMIEGENKEGEEDGELEEEDGEAEDEEEESSSNKREERAGAGQNGNGRRKSQGGRR